MVDVDKGVDNVPKEIKIDLQETIGISDTLKSQLIKIKDDITSITNITNKLYKIELKILVFLLILITMCLSIYFINYNLLAYNRIIYASVGLLTFISIFYSLLISQTGRDVTERMNTLIKKAKERIQEITIKEIRETEIKNLDELQIIGYNSKTKIKRLEDVRIFVDVEHYLILTVFCLLISILYTLFNNESTQRVAYAFFSAGFCLSGIIVVLWRNLPKMLIILESLPEDKK